MKRALLALTLVLTPLRGSAAAQVVEHEPVGVALVLSGGGGRALAQVGVLQVLEELHVPVELVIGCEVGALVGGLHCAGMSGAELERQFARTEWLDAIEGREARRSLSWRRRVESRDFLFELPVALRGWRLGLPRGLIRTRRLNQWLATRTLGALEAEHFDDLATRFRAVATDLESGERVVLDHDLPSSILASMAVPVLLPPIELDGRLLSSGALTGAVPIGLALEFAPRTLIVVDCTPRVGASDARADVLDIAEQVLLLESLRRRDQELARLRPSDVLLQPRVRESSPLDFREPAQAIAWGREAALAAQERLAACALSPQAWREHRERRAARAATARSISAVRFSDTTAIGEDVLGAHVDTRPGEPVRAEILAHDIERLYGLDLHERIDVHLQHDEDDARALEFRTTPADWEPLQLRMGGLVEGDLRGDANFALGAALNWRPLNRRGAEWRNRVELGDRVLLQSEFYQPLDARMRWFVSAQAWWLERRVNLSAGDDVLGVFDVNALGAGLDLGRVLGDWGEIRVGARTADGEVDVAVGDSTTLPTGTYRQGAVRTSLAVDTLDSTAFPREGLSARIEWWSPLDGLGGDDEHYVRLDAVSAHSVGRVTLSPAVSFGTSLENSASAATSFPLGGFLELSGLERDEIAGSHALLTRLAAWSELGSETLERKNFAWYAGASIEAGNVFAERADIEADALILAGSLFVGVQTFFGPAYIGLGSAEQGRRTAFISVGGRF